MHTALSLAPSRSFFRFANLLFPAVLLLAHAVQAQTTAFPGALGFGAYASGGRNGTVYHVTNLNDSGAGSFRDAVSHSGRTVVFDVGGHVTLASAVAVQGNITIAGQTAPGGICFDAGEISFSPRANIICRYIRIRPGSATASTSDDCLSLYQSTNVILDHCSFEFGPWNNIDAVTAHNISVQHCINANPTYQQFGAHTENVGAYWSWTYNIFANSHNRNPLAKINTVFINNLDYNCSAGYTTHTSGKFKHDIVNNYFVAGPASSGSNFPWYQIDNNQSMYFSGNLYDANKNTSLDGTVTVPLPGYQGGGTVLGSPWSSWTTVIPTVSADLAWRYDVSAAGAFPRDDVDALLISQVKTLGNGPSGTGAGTAGPDGSLYTSQSQTGLGNNGYGTFTGLAAPPNFSGDGIADYWKLANNLSTNISYPLTNTASGYTLLENYLNFLAASHLVTQTNIPADINLAQFTRGFAASATFSVTNATNGAVTLLNSTNAHFVPTPNFSGLGSFTFSVTEGNYSLSAIVTVCITPIPPPIGVTQFNGAMVVVMTNTSASSISPPANLLWRGDGTVNAWNTGASNWMNGANLAAFKNGDIVTFDDSGSNTPAITLSSTLTPGMVLFNNTKNYTLAGSGSLSGSGSFSKTGSGTLTISTTNSLGGAFNVSGGTVALTSGAALGSGAMTLSDGATLSLPNTGNVFYGGAINIPAGDSVTIASAALGNGLSGNVTSGDSTTVLNLSSSVSFNGTASSQFSGFTGTVNVPAGSTMRFSLASSGNNFGTANAVFVVNGKLQPRNGGNTVTLGALTGSGQLTGQQTQPPSGGTGNILYKLGGANRDTTFSGTIIDSNPTNLTCVTKTGTGTLTLAGNNTYTGTNFVSSGTLLITGTNSPPLVTVAANATFGGTGVNNGPVTVNSGGILAPGMGGGGTLTINGNLTNNTPTLLYELAASVASGNNDLIAMTGTLGLNGAQNFIFNLVENALGPGAYSLIEGATNSTASSVSFTSNLPGTTRQSFTFSRPAAGSNPSYIRLIVGGNAASLIWSGTNGNTWDAATTVNWLNSGAADVFYNLDTVRLDDSSTNGDITIPGTVQPMIIVVSNAIRDYTLEGSGAFAGFGSLVKQGSGALMLNTTNGFTGGSTVNAGTLALGNSLALGVGPVTLNGGTLALGASVKPGNALFVATASAMTASSLGGIGGVVTGTGNLALAITGSGNTFDISGDLSHYGGTLTVNSSSCFIRFNYSNNATVDNSGADIDLGGGSAQLVNRNAGSFTLGGLSGGPNTKLSGATSLASPSYYYIGANNVSSAFNGSIQDGLGPSSVTKVGTGTLTLGGASTCTGDLDVSAGGFCVTNLSGSASGIGNNLEIFSGATLSGNGIIGSATTVDSGATLAPGNPSGTLTFTNNLTLSDSSILQFGLGTNSDSVAVGGDLALAGQLTVSNAGGFSPGVYTLFTCGGALTFGNFALVSAPAGHNYSFNTNTSGVVKLVIAPTAPPYFSGVSVNGGNLSLSGSNGVPLGSYSVLQSSNLFDWTAIATNQFDASGAFNFTTGIPAGSPQGFFRLQLM